MNAVFNPLEYMKGAEAIGMKREHAEYQAEQLSKLVESELVTKSYLKQELLNLENKLLPLFENKLLSLENRMLIKFGGMMIVAVGILQFLLKH